MAIRHTSFVISLAAALSITACSDIGISPNNATVRFVNAIPGASLLSFTSSAGFPVNNISFEGYSQCTTLAAGTVTFTFGGNGSNIPPTTMNAVTLFGGGNYTVLATGNASAPSSLFLPDTFPAPPPGSATLQIVNQIPNSGTVDVYAQAPNTPLVTPSQTGLVSGGVTYITVPARQALQVWLTTTQTTTIVATTTATLNFPSGDEETLFFLGSAGGSSALSFIVPNCR